MNVAPVYAPALVVFLGNGGIGFGGNVGWFPLGPREVYIPSYNVSRGYMSRVNISNTTVNNTTITNIYNTNIVNRSTSITNAVYLNRNVAGAITAVPQRAFINAQPVARVAVAVNAREVASMSMSSRASVAPSRESVLGLRGNGAGRVVAPPPAIASRQVIAKALPPPPPVPFARQQQILSAHPGQPLERNEVQSLRPANAPAVQPMVKMAPVGKPAIPSVGRPGTQRGNAPITERQGQPANTPSANRPGNQPVPNEPPRAVNPSQPNIRPEPGRSIEPPTRNDRPFSVQPKNRQEPDPSRPTPRSQTPLPGERIQQPAPSPEIPVTPKVDQPRNNPGNLPNSERPGRPTNRPPADRPDTQSVPTEPPPAVNPTQPNNQPELSRPGPTPQSHIPPASDRKQLRTPPPEKTGPALQQEPRPKSKTLTPEEKKRLDEQQKKDEKPPV